MAPRKKTAKSAENQRSHPDSTSTQNGSQSSPEKKHTANSGKKRKQPPTGSNSSGNNSNTGRANQGSRKSARGDRRANPSQTQLLRYMLSQEAEDLCRPADEARDLQGRKDQGEDISHFVTYTSSVLNPFQELVCAIVLSRPISHMLGLRTIRTLFNAPYEFTSARRMQDAGMDKIHKALWDARTQHKAKTADQLGALADMVLDLFTDEASDRDGTELGAALRSSDVNGSLQQLVNKIKGFGPTGRDIFRRRVQWLWEASYPFADERSSVALGEIGLPSDAEDLSHLIDGQWHECDTERLAGKTDEQKKKRALVIVLERATSASLEGKVESLREAAEAT